MSQYVLLIGYPSTGKNIAMDIIRKAIYKIEKFQGIAPNQSLIINSHSAFSILDHFTVSNQRIGKF